MLQTEERLVLWGCRNDEASVSLGKECAIFLGGHLVHTADVSEWHQLVEVGHASVAVVDLRVKAWKQMVQVASGKLPIVALASDLLPVEALEMLGGKLSEIIRLSGDWRENVCRIQRVVESWKHRADRLTCLQMMSHDMQNPLASIRLLAGILKDELVDDEELTQDIQELLQATDLLGLQVNGISSLSVRDVPSVVKPSGPIDLAKVLHEVLRHPAFHWTLESVPARTADAWVYVDTSKLRTVVTHLVLFAHRLLTRSGALRIGLVEEAMAWRLELDMHVHRSIQPWFEAAFSPFGVAEARRAGVPLSPLGLHEVSEFILGGGGSLQLRQLAPNHERIELRMARWMKGRQDRQ